MIWFRKRFLGLRVLFDQRGSLHPKNWFDFREKASRQTISKNPCYSGFRDLEIRVSMFLISGFCFLSLCLIAYSIIGSVLCVRPHEAATAADFHVAPPARAV